MIVYYLLVFIMPLIDHRFWGRFVGSMTMTKYLGAACLAYALVYMVVPQKIPRPLHSLQALFLGLFYLIATISYFTRRLRNSEMEMSPFLSYTSYLVFYFVTATVIDTRQRLRSILVVIAASGALASLYVLREWQSYHNLIPHFRPGWVLGDANYYTLSALPCILIAFCLFRDHTSRWQRWFAFACLAITLAGVMLAASRGGFLGLAVAMVFVVWRSGARLRNLALTSTFLIPFLILMPQSPLQRLIHPDYSDNEAKENREVTWRAGLNMIKAHPITGIGLGNFKPEVEKYEPDGPKVFTLAHNTYIEVAAETGLPAFFLFAALLFVTLRTLAKTQRRAAILGATLVQQAALALEAGLAGVAVAIFFVSAEYQRAPWLVISLSACLAPLLSSRTSSVREVAPQRMEEVAWVPIQSQYAVPESVE